VLNRFIQLVQFYKKFLLYTELAIITYRYVSMSVGQRVHILSIVHNSMQHMTWKSLGLICGWVVGIRHRNSSMLGYSSSKVPLLSIWFVTVPLNRPLLLCLVN